jgi:hypothetical protein
MDTINKALLTASPYTVWSVGSLSLPNRANADACFLNYLKEVQLAFLGVPVMNHAISFNSSARISYLLRFFLSSEGCCVTSVNVPPPAQRWPEALSSANGTLNVEPR